MRGRSAFMALKDITIGQYYQADSLLHRLDPRTKIIGTLIFILSLFLADSSLAYLLAAVFLTISVLLSQVPVKFVLRGMKAIFILLLITVVFNLFLTPGKTVVSFWIFTITDQGIRTAAMMGIRLIFLIIGSSVMTLTTTPSRLTDGLESLLGPMKKIGVPVHEIAMMMALALRFIQILKAQMARGASFDQGKIIERAKSMVPLLVPLFISAFRRANDLAMAMEARCYHGGEGRTKMKPLIYRRRDFLTYLFFACYLGIMIAGMGYPLRLRAYDFY